MRRFRWVVVCLLVSFPLRSGASSAPDPQGASEEVEAPDTGWGRVTLPGGTWLVALRLGFRDPRSSDDDSHLAAQMDLGVGLSDRVELRPFWLAVRLGSPRTAEVLLQAGSRGFGRTQGHLLLVPTLGAQAILPVERGQRLVLGAQASTFATKADDFASFVGKWTGTVIGGGSFQVGDRLLFTVGAAVGQDWGRDFYLPRSSTESRATFVEFGSVVAHGGSPLPLISYRVADWVAIDGSASLRLDEGLPSLLQTLGGFSFWF